MDQLPMQNNLKIGFLLIGVHHFGVARRLPCPALSTAVEVGLFAIRPDRFAAVCVLRRRADGSQHILVSSHVFPCRAVLTLK